MTAKKQPSSVMLSPKIDPFQLGGGIRNQVSKYQTTLDASPAVSRIDLHARVGSIKLK
jgi:hypothetical protein